MTGFIRHHRSKLAALALLALGVLTLWHYAPQVKNSRIYFTQEMPAEGARSIPLGTADYSGTSRGNIPVFWWAFDITKGSASANKLRLTVDDCMERLLVNGREADLRHLSREALCDISRGISVDFNPYLQEGENQVLVQVSDIGGQYRVSYAPFFLGGIGLDQFMLVVCLLPLMVFTQRRLLPADMRGQRAAKGYYAVFYLGVALACYRFLVVVPGENTHDFTPHISYLNYVMAEWWRPNPGRCLECYQPPIYYFIGAVFYRMGEWVGLLNPHHALKALGLIFYMGMTAVAVRLILRFGLSHRAALLALALFMLRPFSVIEATDINADVAVAMMILLSLHYTLNWYERLRYADAVWALAAAAVGMLVKSSALVAFALFGVVGLLLLWERRVTLRDFFRARYVMLFALAALIGFSNLMYLHSVRTGNRSIMVYNSVMSHKDLAFEDDKPSYYVTFPLSLHLDTPYLNTYDDASGRRYFWSAVLKTASFGEWGGDGWNVIPIAKIINGGLLLMLIYMAAFYARFWSTGGVAAFPHLRIAGYAALLMIVMLMSFRISQPAGCNQNMRYIYASMPLFCLFYAFAIDRLRRSGARRVAGLGWVLGIAMALLGMAHVLFSYGSRY